ncbi:hypothetical protein Tco_0939491 [Tanacetum coccineum]|uniref:Uncharacterized protein n=1 Tax=Tanacetum coccineum TaxID=301880 RepID=A0ABQ5DK70_9ASTR
MGVEGGGAARITKMIADIEIGTSMDRYTTKLFTPYKEPEREFRSSRRHFKTLSLDELRSPDFNLLFVPKIITSGGREAEGNGKKSIEQYMSKFTWSIGWRVILCSKFCESILTPPGRVAMKIKILDSKGAIPSKTAADAKVAIQEMAEYSQKWHNGTSRTISLHYTKYCPLKEEGKTLEEAYYTQFGGSYQGGGYRAAASGFYQRNNANPSYQERRQSMEETLSKFMSESTKRH